MELIQYNDTKNFNIHRVDSNKKFTRKWLDEGYIDNELIWGKASFDKMIWP